jgi:hypothetical protein
MAAIQDATLVVKALEMALARRCPQGGLLHHGDSWQYLYERKLSRALAAKRHAGQHESHS